MNVAPGDAAGGTGTATASGELEGSRLVAAQDTVRSATTTTGARMGPS
jgi:hypothetical protein